MTKPGSPKNPRDPKGKAEDTDLASPSMHEPSEESSSTGAHGETVPPATHPVDREPSPGYASVAEPKVENGSDANSDSDTRPLDASADDTSTSQPASEPAPRAVHGGSAAAASSKKGGSSTGTVALVLGVLALASIGATGYYGWQQMQERDQRLAEISSQLQQVNERTGQQSNASTQQLQALQAEVARLRERPQDQQLVESVNQQVESIQQQFASFAREQNQQLGQMETRLNGQQQRLLNMSTTNREDWLMAEAEYLLRLANQRVLIERSASSAVGLLESADAILEQVAEGLGDPEVFAIRKAIAQDLTALRLVQPVDKEGLYLQLEALADKISQLPTSPELGLREASASNTSAGTAASDAQSDRWYTRVWQEVKSMAGVFDQYVRIQDTEAPTKPLVDESSLRLAQLNLRLALEQAQVAMLREEEAIYRLSLERAQQLVDEYFQPAPATAEFKNQLESLAEVDVVPELPDISESLQLLHGYIEDLHRSRPKEEEAQS